MISQKLPRVAIASLRRRQQSPSQTTTLDIVQVGSAPADEHSRGGMATVTALLAEHPDPAVRVQHITSFRDTTRPRQAAIAAAALMTLTRRCATTPPDVVHIHVSYKGSVARKSAVLHIARLFGVPTVLHAHSHGFRAWFDTLSPREQGLVRAGLVADRWVVLGHGLRDEYIQMFGLDPEQVHVLHNPVAVAPSPRAPRESTETVTALFLGRVGERKGIPELLAAVAALPEDVRDRLQVVIAGDGNVDHWRERARDLRVAHAFQFLGWVGPEECTGLLADADFFVLPSHEEGLPMAMLEAMGVGRAVLVTPVGAIGEVIRDGHNGLLVPPGDVPALTEALQRLITDDDLRHRIARAGSDTAADLNVDQWRARLVDIWRAASRRPRSG